MTRRRRMMTRVALVAACAIVVTLTGCTSPRVGTAPSDAGPLHHSSRSSAASPGAAPDNTAVAVPGRPVVSLTVRGRDRTYRLHVPAGTAGAGPVPLLVALHGGGGSGAHFEAVSGFDRIADSAGFIVAYPDAVRPAGQVATWDAGDCCGYAARIGIDDVGFVRAVMGSVEAGYRIDPRQVYVAGYSNGGMLAYRIACQLAGTVAAVGVQSATLEYSPCQPSQPVALIHLHGTADTQVPLAGGHGSGLSRADFTPPLQAVTTVAVADGCHSTPTPRVDLTLPGAELRTWPGCPPGIGVQLVTVPGAGHAWMRSSAPQIWTFLAAHAR